MFDLLAFARKSPACLAICIVMAWGAVLAQAQDAGDVPETTNPSPVDETEAPAHNEIGASEGSEDLAIPADALRDHLADPEAAKVWLEEDLEAARARQDQSSVEIYTHVLERIDSIRRDERRELSLVEALQWAMAGSYDIEVQRFNPAIDTTRIVEAEAAFDAAFFANFTKNIQDRPSASQLQTSSLNLLDVTAGVRKLLPTGGTATASYGFRRTKTAIQFQLINPEYFSNLTLELRQPLLRGFGIDFNRSVIRISGNNRRISQSAFERQVRDKLREVEELYWRLVQARRDVLITARTLADFESIYDNLYARRDFDITPVQIEATRANLESSRADFVRVRAAVFDAEDRLISAMNNGQLNLADSIEIIPVDFPPLTPIEVDRLGEVQTALDNRREIKEQEIRVESARISAGQAKNQELPQLDLTFRYVIDGLGRNYDQSFDELSRNNFNEYFIGVVFELPIGNRARRSAHQRAMLQHRQAVAALRGVFEDVILDVNLAVRSLETSYDQISPSFESAQARRREVDSIVARAERKDIATLQNELGSRQSLASSRRALLSAIIEYNIAIIDLERAKGTLLRYNNVTVDSP